MRTRTAVLVLCMAAAIPLADAQADILGREPAASSADGSPTPVKVVKPVRTGAVNSGAWQTLAYKVPGLAVHATVMNDGRVLLVEGSGNNGVQFAAGTFNVWVWDPAAGTFQLQSNLPTDLFCGGHAAL